MRIHVASRLTAAARQRAVFFITENGTTLQRARLSHIDGQGCADEVYTALAGYRNHDGGFGHGLEPDLRTTQSSVLATTIALQILGQLDTPADHPLITGAMSYLASQFNGSTFPLIHEGCNDAPHAPWWRHIGEAPAGVQPNPDAEVLGYLLQYGTSLPDPVVDALLQQLVTWPEENNLEMHELLCYVRLYDCPVLGEPYRERLLPHLVRNVFELVKVDPNDWEEYSLTPLDVVTSPASPFLTFFGDVIDLDFEHRIARQGEDGAWRPAWTWGEMFPATWQVVEPEIKAELTLHFLNKLQRFDEISA